MQAEAQELESYKRQFTAFFEDPNHDGAYIAKIREAIQDGGFRLIVNINDLRTHDRPLAEK